jgi:hypothetical protein
VARTLCRGSSGSEQSQIPRADTDCDVSDNEKDDKYFGDTMGKNEGQVIRVGCINLNNTPQTIEGDKGLF